MSPKRVVAVRQTSSELELDFVGSAGEDVLMSYIMDGAVVELPCILGKNGMATLKLLARSCSQDGIPSTIIPPSSTGASHYEFTCMFSFMSILYIHVITCLSFKW